MSRWPAFLVLFLLAAVIEPVTLPAVAAEVAYRFETAVATVVSSPWQLPNANFSPVMGAFVYDTLSPPTHVAIECDCVGYRQQRLNGFFADFGGLVVRADDYVVEVRNNVPFGLGGEADVITLSFASNLAPSLEFPLVVDSVPRSGGLFSLSFAGPTSLFDSTALPSTLHLGSFHTKLGFLSDTAGGFADVLFSASSMARWDLLPGDYDLDNGVDVDDYQKWKATYGSSGDLMADGNRDGIVDAADYTIWRNALQTLSGFSPEGASANVLEPTFTVLLVIGVGWLASSSRYRVLATPKNL